MIYSTLIEIVNNFVIHSSNCPKSQPKSLIAQAQNKLVFRRKGNCFVENVDTREHNKNEDRFEIQCNSLGNLKHEK